MLNSYKKIRELREMLIEEIRTEVGILTVAHLQLVEMRLQTVLMANLDTEHVRKEKPFKRNENP